MLYTPLRLRQPQQAFIRDVGLAHYAIVILSGRYQSSGYGLVNIAATSWLLMMILDFFGLHMNQPGKISIEYYAYVSCQSTLTFSLCGFEIQKKIRLFHSAR